MRYAPLLLLAPTSALLYSRDLPAWRTAARPRAAPLQLQSALKLDRVDDVATAAAGGL